jgi:hypothetical protein
VAYQRGPYTPQSGPFGGSTFSSYRQYLNAKEYLRETGVVGATREETRGAFSRVTRERRAVIERAVAHVPRGIRGQNYEYLLQRATEQEAGRQFQRDPFKRAPNLDAIKARLRRPGSTFNKLYRAAERQGFRATDGSALDALLYAAGMRSGATAEERQRYNTMVEWYLEHDELADLSADDFAESDAA